MTFLSSTLYVGRVKTSYFFNKRTLHLVEISLFISEQLSLKIRKRLIDKMGDTFISMKVVRNFLNHFTLIFVKSTWCCKSCGVYSWFNIGLGNMKCGNICIEYITDNILVININDKMLYVLRVLPNIRNEPYLVFF